MNWMIITAALLGCIAVFFCGCHSGHNGDEPPEPIPPEPEPMKPIIWMHNCPVHSAATLEKALSSGLITHVWILYLNPADAPLPLPRANEAIAVCKKYRVKVIWARTLWPSYKIEDFKREDMSNPEYYKNFIEKLRAEAQQLGADYTGVDTEPYTYFPFLEIKKNPLTEDEFEAVQNAVDLAVAEVNQIDFVAPSCGYFANHFYSAVKRIGKLGIGEHTGYDIPWKFDRPYWPYDIFCARVNIAKTFEGVPEGQPGSPTVPFFTLQEVLWDRANKLWRGKKAGLFISANHSGIKEVAEQLATLKTVTVP